MRHLEWDGYVNVRDLGGLPTRLSLTGATVVGRVARGPRRELLTDAGWRGAKRWGLRTVVDVRCAWEIGARDGDPHVSRGSITGVGVVHAPTEDQDDPEFRAVCFPILDSPEYWHHNWRILPTLVNATLTAIARADPGILVHCSAGRDRTGMITALLLANAGVSPADVAADYAESVRVMAGTQAHALSDDRQASWTQHEVDSWIAQTAPIVEHVAADYVEAFDTIGLDQDTRHALRALLTSD